MKPELYNLLCVLQENEELFYSHPIYLCGGQKWGMSDEGRKYTISDIVKFLHENCNDPDAVCWIADMLER